MSPDYPAIALVILGSIALAGYILAKPSLNFRGLLLLGLCLRLFFLAADYNHWFPIVNSGADTEMFHMVSAANVGKIVQQGNRMKMRTPPKKLAIY